MKKAEADFFVSVDGLNPFTFEGAEFEKYFNNCGDALTARYPVLNLVINNNTNSDLLQDHFDFLRTDDGYKLISISIRNGSLK